MAASIRKTTVAKAPAGADAASAAGAPELQAHGCSTGTTGTAARCRGAKRPIRTTSSCRKSCCSRRRSIACCRNTTSGSRSIPSFEALADAPERDVTETWRPLGYNIRPKRLQAIAREAVATYGGKLPSDEATLLSFKGIGAYTAGAIRSFAFRERAAILDTNVARVLFRVFIGKGVPKAHATKKDLWSISAALVPRSRAFDFNQALMDFGATLCTARKPKCLICPMAPLCAAYPHNPENETTCLSASSSSRP